MSSASNSEVVLMVQFDLHPEHKDDVRSHDDSSVITASVLFHSPAAVSATAPPPLL